jgi:hypothetical protein
MLKDLDSQHQSIYSSDGQRPDIAAYESVGSVRATLPELLDGYGRDVDT